MKLKINFFRECLFFGLFVISTMLLVVSGPLKAMQSTNNECPSAWGKYIDVVKDVIADRDQGNRFWVLFADEIGTVYNCLGEGISDQDIALIQVFEKDLARVKAIVDAQDREKGYPRGRASDCGFGKNSFTSMPVFVVSLPSAEKVMNAGFCSEGFLQTIVDRISQLQE